jgi:hypothetical protein
MIQRIKVEGAESIPRNIPLQENIDKRDNL